MNRIAQILIERDGYSLQEANEIIQDCADYCTEEGADPEEVLLEDLGLEPDYIMDFIAYFNR